MSKHENYTIWGSIAFLLIFTLSPLLKLFTVTGDDFEYFLSTDTSLWMEHAKMYAEGTGRFYFLLVKWIYEIPYLIESPFYYHCCAIIPIISCFALLFWLVLRISRSNSTTQIFALVTVATWGIYGEHSVFNAYPFYFSFSLNLLLVAFHFLINYYTKKQRYWIYLSALFMLIANLFYETYLIYYIGIFCTIIHFYRRKGALKNWKGIARDTLPFVITGLAYLITYIVYYSLHTSSYGGNMVMTDFSFQRAASTFSRLFFNSFPLSSYGLHQELINNHITLYDEHTSSYFLNCFYSIGPLCYVKAVAIYILWVLVFRRLKMPRNRSLIIGSVFLGVLFTALPHIPIAITEKYSYYQLDTYLSTSLAFFGVILLITSTSIFLVNLFKRQLYRKMVMYGFGALIFIVALYTQSMTYHAACDMELSRNRFTLMDLAYNEEYLLEGMPVYTEALNNPGTYFGHNTTRQKNMFAVYFEKVNNFTIKYFDEYEHLNYEQFYNKYKDAMIPVYINYYEQIPKTGEAVLVVGRCWASELTPNMKDLVFSEATFAYHPAISNKDQVPFAWKIKREVTIPEEDIIHAALNEYRDQ